MENPRWYKGKPIWNTVEKQGLKAGIMFWVGSEAPIQGMRPTHWKPYDESISYKARVDTVVQWLAAPDSQAVDFASLYFDQPDHNGHLYGPQSDSVKAAVERADQVMGYLRDKMQATGLWDSTNVIVLSDHGMAELSVDKTINLDDLIDFADVKRKILGPVSMIQPKEGREEAVYSALKSNADHYRVYKKEALPERYHIKESRRMFDIVLVADLGYTVLTDKNKDQFKKRLPAGTLGYDPKNEEMQAIFMVHGPDFKKDKTVPTFRNVHVYDLMAHLLHIEPAPNDGSLDSVRAMVKK